MFAVQLEKELDLTVRVESSKTEIPPAWETHRARMRNETSDGGRESTGWLFLDHERDREA